MFDSLIAYLFVVLSVSTLSILYFILKKDESIVDKDIVKYFVNIFSRKMSIHVVSGGGEK